MKICSVEDCNGKHKSRGMCAKHYSSWKLHDSNLGKICKVKNCNNKVHSHEFCGKHVQRWKRHGDPLIETRKFAKDSNYQCSIDGCNKEYIANGYCSMHYQRYKTHKNPFIIGSSLEFETAIETFEAKVIKTSKYDCWGWQGLKNIGGYAVFSHKKMYIASRLIYEHMYGKFDDNLIICHFCDNPECTNFLHLFVGTPKDNSQDMVNKGRSVKGQKNPRAILSNEQVIEIKKMIQQGLKNRHIGPIFNVDADVISNIRCGQTWSHIKLGEDNV